MRGPSHWWVRARAADGRVWTIGVLGLGGSTPPVRTGDVVTLDLDWRTYDPVAMRAPDGQLQLSDASGTPLLWAGAGRKSTWISFAPGDDACVPPASCMVQTNVIATVNGSSTTLPPYGAASLGGYFLQVTTFPRLCGDYISGLEAAAAKVSPMNSP
jgi:hypothetical protein